MKKYKLALCTFALFFVMLVSPTAKAAFTFDWRDIGGEDYTTPVKNQNPCGTCWAFATLGAMEAKFDITYGNPSLDLDLSEQHLIMEPTLGGCMGGEWPYNALAFIQSYGIVDEATLPNTWSDASPNWQLTPPNTLYSITDYIHPLPSDTVSLQNALMTYGPLIAVIETEWYWPTGTALGSTETPSWFLDMELGPTSHAVTVTGYQDDPSLSGGGYWVIKNSWGTGWGDNGYGYLNYDATIYHMDAINGDAFVIPAPGAILLGSMGIGLVSWLRMRRTL